MQLVAVWNADEGALPFFEVAPARDVGNVTAGRIERLPLKYDSAMNYDVGLCEVRWRDGLGLHDERLDCIAAWRTVDGE